jgi:hypothetical protein
MQIPAERRASRGGAEGRRGVTTEAKEDGLNPLLRLLRLRGSFLGVDGDGPFRYLRIGWGSRLNLLEVMYNEVDEDTICVFHMMKCRDEFLPLLGT